jgi:hypothetical protein
MRFTVAFSHNSEGLFRVTAAANPNAHKGIGFVVAIYKDEATFCHLVQAAGLQPDETKRLIGAVELTEFNHSTPACCEDVDLDDEQLQILRLTNARTLVIFLLTMCRTSILVWIGTLNLLLYPKLGLSR